MDWHPLTPIDVQKLPTPALQAAAAVLNKRIADLNGHRADIDSGKTNRFHGKLGTPHDEAIRREIVLRTDILKLYEKAVKAAPAFAVQHTHHESLKAHHELLLQRGTHTHAKGGGF